MKDSVKNDLRTWNANNRFGHLGLIVSVASDREFRYQPTFEINRSSDTQLLLITSSEERTRNPWLKHCLLLVSFAFHQQFIFFYIVLSFLSDKELKEKPLFEIWLPPNASSLGSNVRFSNLPTNSLYRTLLKVFG